MPHIKSSYGYGLGSSAFASSFGIRAGRPAKHEAKFALFFKAVTAGPEPRRLAYLML
jgi:hypothetical protein